MKSCRTLICELEKGNQWFTNKVLLLKAFGLSALSSAPSPSPSSSLSSLLFSAASEGIAATAGDGPLTLVLCRTDSKPDRCSSNIFHEADSFTRT